MKKLISVTAIAFMLASGAAFAQDTTTTTGSTNATDAAEVEMLKPFYTDDTMATLRTDAEIKAAWDGMKAEERTALEAKCKEPGVSPRMTGVCDRVNPS